jgi:hypothetical protein
MLSSDDIVSDNELVLNHFRYLINYSESFDYFAVMKPSRLTINDGPVIAHAVETALDNEFRPSALYLWTIQLIESLRLWAGTHPRGEELFIRSLTITPSRTVFLNNFVAFMNRTGIPSFILLFFRRIGAIYLSTNGLTPVNFQHLMYEGAFGGTNTRW